MGKRVLVMAGGTGGHVFPALAVAQYLLQQGHTVTWVGTRKGLEARVVPAANIPIDFIGVGGIRGKGWWAKFKAPWMLLVACWQALTVLRLRKPDVALGMGGFVAGPGALMAKISGVPLVIHEQNSVPGTTNRILRRIANRVLQAFPDSFPPEAGAICTGNPLRENFQGLVSDKPKRQNRPLHILVLGGSQGAQALNETLPPVLASVPDVLIRHQTGTAMHDAVQAAYRTHGADAIVDAFIDNMADAYQWADVAICRAGAMTVSELAAAGLPAILVPFPFAIDDHQTANARYLSQQGAAVLLPQPQLDGSRLLSALDSVRANWEMMAAAARSCARLDATATVAAYCLQEAGA